MDKQFKRCSCWNIQQKIGRYLKAGTQFKDLPKVVQEALRKYGIDDVSRGGQPFDKIVRK